MKLIRKIKGTGDRWRFEINIFRLLLTLSNTPVRFRSRQDKHLSQNERRKMKLTLMAHRGNVCELCGRMGDEVFLELHHIKPIMKHPELARSLDNIMLVCHECHKGIHKEIDENEKLIEK